jgi:hypothetical protein
MLGQVSVLRVNRAEKRGWKGGYVSTFRGVSCARRATFQRFAAMWLREAGLVSMFRSEGVPLCRDRFQCFAAIAFATQGSHPARL